MKISQPAISGHNVVEEKSFLPCEDVPSFVHSTVGSSHEQDRFSDVDTDSSGSPNMSLAEGLRSNMLRDEVTRSVYMPWHILRTVMTRNMVVSELKLYYGAFQVQEYASLICSKEAQNHALAQRWRQVPTRKYSLL